MIENTLNSTVSPSQNLLDHELHLIRCYREALKPFSGNYFESLVTTMLEDLEQSVRVLRGHITNAAKHFWVQPERPPDNEFFRKPTPEQTTVYLMDGEHKALRKCERVVNDKQSPEPLRSYIRTSLTPTHENHVAVLEIIASADRPGPTG